MKKSPHNYRPTDNSKSLVDVDYQMSIQSYLKIAGSDVIAFYKTLSGWPKHAARNQSERSLQMDTKNKMAVPILRIAVRLYSSLL